MSYILSSILHTANREIRESRQVVAYKSLKTMENHYFKAQKDVAVAYRRWSFTKGSNCHASTGKVLPVFWIGSRLWEVDAHGDSTIWGIMGKSLS